MIYEHAAALWTLAEGQSVAPVYRGSVPPTLAAPYVVVYVADSDPERGPSLNINGTAATFTCWIYVHSVGGTEDAALRVADAIRTRLLGVRPTVAGRQCQPIRRELGQPVERDQTASSARWTKADVYRLDTEPA